MTRFLLDTGRGVSRCSRAASATRRATSIVSPQCLHFLAAMFTGSAQTYKTYRSKVEKGERKTDVVEMATLCQLYGTTASELLKGIGIE